MTFSQLRIAVFPDSAKFKKLRKMQRRYFNTDKVLQLLFDDDIDDDIDCLSNGYPDSMDSAEEEPFDERIDPVLDV